MMICHTQVLPAATSLRSATNVARSDELFNNLSERATLVAERSEVAAGNIVNTNIKIKKCFYCTKGYQWDQCLSLGKN